SFVVEGFESRRMRRRPRRGRAKIQKDFMRDRIPPGAQSEALLWRDSKAGGCEGVRGGVAQKSRRILCVTESLRAHKAKLYCGGIRKPEDAKASEAGSRKNPEGFYA